jgi:hypothetical protein
MSKFILDAVFVGISLVPFALRPAHGAAATGYAVRNGD